MNLHQDIIMEILLRLPAKSLLRFRSVCKSWYALIKSSRFINQHQAIQSAMGNDCIIVKYFKNAEKKHVVSYYADYESLSLLISPPEFEIPCYPKANDWGWPPIFVGEVNGIVCLTDTVTITLMNPALREFRMLPPFRIRASGVGFGFDESTNDYKVLIIDDDRIGDHPFQHQFCAVYNLSSNSWRELERLPLLHYYYGIHDFPCIFFNGSVHWYAMGLGIGFEGKHMILTFNMTTESFREMQIPQGLEEDSQSYTALLVLNKSFLACVSVIESESYGFFLNIWVMKEYGIEDSWTKQHCIQVVSSIGRPLSFWKKNKLIFNTTSETELVCCDLSTGELHEIQQFDSYGFYEWSIGLLVFNESLVSINNI